MARRSGVQRITRRAARLGTVVDTALWFAIVAVAVLFDIARHRWRNHG